MKKKLLLIFIMILSLFTFTSCEEEAYDEIESYKVDITTNDDGTLNITYDVKWHVLKDGDEDFILFGIPNEYTKLISVAENEGIKRGYLYDNSDGYFVRLDLTENFKAGNEINIEFTILQDYMFTVGEENNQKYINYEYIPGWFDEIQVKNITVSWDSDGIIEADSSASLKGGKYVWSAVLDKGESIKCNVSYEKDYFPNIDINKEYHGYEEPDDTIYIIIVVSFIIFAIIIVIVAIIASKNSTGYYSYRGFYPHYRHHYFFWHRTYGVDRSGKKYIPPTVNNGRGGSTGGRSCACACACACAGGGRAGCSRKDFYKPNLKVENF